MIYKRKLTKGFTLIELVIVVSIIALISGISLFALNNARTSGRDARRKADLEEVASGLELYKADLNYYPDDSGVTFGGTLEGGSNTYIQAVPNDPNTSNDYVYDAFPADCDNSSSSDLCTSFRLWALLEEEPSSWISYCGDEDDAPSCGDGGDCNYCVVNP